jgi:uncharacterized protein DUF1566
MNKLAPRLVGVALFVMVLLAALITQATAPAGRYTISAGTVYDTKTQLYWAQTASPGTYMQSNAATYCSGLGGAWRVPKMKELFTIVDLSVVASTTVPSIDATAFPSTPAAHFWCADANVGNSSSGWIVDFSTGTALGESTGATDYVRCVH